MKGQSYMIYIMIILVYEHNGLLINGYWKQLKFNKRLYKASGTNEKICGS